MWRIFSPSSATRIGAMRLGKHGGDLRGHGDLVRFANMRFGVMVWCTGAGGDTKILKCAHGTVVRDPSGVLLKPKIKSRTDR